MTTHPRSSRNSPKLHPASTVPLGKKRLNFQPAIVRSSVPQNRVLSRCLSLAQVGIGIAGSWLAGSTAFPAHAATLLNNSGIQFEQDTTLESNFVESHGAYQSTFGVINLDTQEKTPLLIETKASDDAESIFKPSSFRSHLGTNTDFLGTPGNAVPQPVAQYKFRANQRYVLYLESSYKGRPTGILYSTDTLNPTREQQARFSGGVNDLCNSGITVGWDDTGSKLVRRRADQDRDFDDFVVQLKNTACGVGSDQIRPPQTSPPAIAALPPAVGGGGGFSPLWLAPLALIPLIDSGNSGPSCPNGDCTPVPEPLTILGSGSAIVTAALMERRRKRKRK